MASLRSHIQCSVACDGKSASPKISLTEICLKKFYKYIKQKYKISVPRIDEKIILISSRLKNTTTKIYVDAIRSNQEHKKRNLNSLFRQKK